MVEVCGFFSALVLLYLLVAFDTVDHFMFLAFVACTFGIPSTSVGTSSVILIDLILLRDSDRSLRSFFLLSQQPLRT